MSGGPSILRPEVIKEDGRHRNEPEPNPEEEGQPAGPHEIDGVEESEEDADHRQR